MARQLRVSRPDSFRTIIGIEWARPKAQGPFGPSRGKKGAKAQGLRYERAVARELSELGVHGQWFQFQDACGLGWCQTDMLVRGKKNALVLEAKLTWLEGAHRQIERLYRPVVEAAFGMPVLGIVVVKNLAPGMGDRPIVADLAGAIEMCRRGLAPVLHWRDDIGLSLVKRAGSS